MPFHEKAGRSQVGSFVFSLDTVFLSRSESESSGYRFALGAVEHTKAGAVGSGIVVWVATLSLERRSLFPRSFW
jgi:hypothetical protein